jgi:orotidine-5'-phosphate decarboxylase
MHFADALLSAIEKKRSHVVVGLDPDYSLLPPEVREKHEQLDYEDETAQVCGAYREFLFRLLPLLASSAVAVKPQLAYFEALGSAGYALYEEVVEAARRCGYLVIADAKRGDIGSTAEAYARGHLDRLGADAITVNPWLGTDGLEPFLIRAREAGKGVFVLLKTSNPSAAEIQDLVLAAGGTVSERVAELLRGWAAGTMGERGYASVGAVVGWTHPAQAEGLRALLPGIPFLVPGYGAQGATAADIARVFDGAGTGAAVNSSRGILYAYRKREGSWADAALAETEAMRQALWQAAGRG